MSIALTYVNDVFIHHTGVCSCLFPCFYVPFFTFMFDLSFCFSVSVVFFLYYFLCFVFTKLSYFSFDVLLSAC